VSECDREVWIMRRPWHTRGLFGAWKKKGMTNKMGGMWKEAVEAQSLL